MKKKFTFGIFLFTISIFTLESCSNDDNLYDNEHYELQKKERIVTNSTKSIAETLAIALKSNTRLADNINSAISKVVSFGLDENLTLFDILNTSNSVFFESNHNFNDLKEVFKTLSPTEYNASNYYKNLNLYWGYHDKWDNITTPIIGYIDSTTTEYSIGAFEIKNNDIVNVRITQEQFDSANKPIIIVNFSKVDYSIYPDFKNGKRTKGNINFPTPIKDGEINFRKIGKYNDPNKVYEAVFRALQSTDGTQYDSFWDGGSEFLVKSGYINYAYQGCYTVNRCDFTRNQIKNRTIIYYEHPVIFPDWLPIFQDIELHLIESDSEIENSSIHVALSIENIGSLDINIPVSNQDDMIAYTHKTRYAYTQNIETGDTWYQLGGMRIALGMKLYNKTY